MLKTSIMQSTKIRDTIPGPGTYNPHSPLGTKSLKFTFKSRIMKEIKCDSPSPNTYNPCFNLVTKANFKNISFGIGDRCKVRETTHQAQALMSCPASFMDHKLKGRIFLRMIIHELHLRCRGVNCNFLPECNMLATQFRKFHCSSHYQ